MVESDQRKVARNLLARFYQRRRAVVVRLGELESLIERRSDPEEVRFEEQLLRDDLQHLKTLMILGLEQLGLYEARRDLARTTEPLAHKGADLYEYLQEPMVADCPLLARLDHYLEAAHLIADTTEDIFEQDRLERLEYLLEDTAALVHRQNDCPNNEYDVQKVMHDYLSVVFPDFVRKPVIPASLKHFIPDGGIRSLNTAIEFKYVDSPDELKRALSGVFEDMAGYSGSRDWSRFYSVFYLTRPFASQSAIFEEVRRPGANSWKPVVVVGGGGRAKRN